MKLLKNLSLLLSVLVLGSSLMFAQSRVIGQLHDIDEANELYGPVLESIEMSTTELFNILQKTDEYVMFNIKHGQVIITDNDRKLISPYTVQLASLKHALFVPREQYIDDYEVMYKWSTCKVLEVIAKGGQSYTKIERRAEKFTMTNGEYTLQFTIPCPPVCD